MIDFRKIHLEKFSRAKVRRLFIVLGRPANGIELAELYPARRKENMDIPFIGRRLANRHDFREIMTNAAWLCGDKLVRLGMAMFVGVWVARYLGPRQFGLLNYAIAFSALFGPIATLGLDKVVVLELVNRPAERYTLMGSAFFLQLLAGLFALGCCVATIAVVRPDDKLSLWMVGICSSGFVFQSLYVIDYYFQSLVRSKYTVWALNSAFLLVALAKILLILYKAPLISFAGAGLAELALSSLFLTVAYRYSEGKIRAWRFEPKVAWRLLKASWPLILSSFAVVIYMRVDQIMLGQMKGDQEVGIFSAAVRISEVWYFIPMAVANSVYPAIIKAKARSEASYYEKLQKLMDMMATLGLAVAVVITFLSPRIIQMLYGDNYAPAAGILTVHIWAGLFVCLGVIGSNWFMAENLQKLLFYRTCAGAIVNVALNLYLIPIYGAMGAAVSTIVSQGCAAVFLNALAPATRPIFRMQIKSLLQHGVIAPFSTTRDS